MLVLQREKHRRVIIGDDIEIIAVEMRCDTVSLGIEVPADVSIHREEIYEAIKQEQQATTGSESDAQESA